jgi:hypothetical protein
MQTTKAEVGSPVHALRATRERLEYPHPAKADAKPPAPRKANTSESLAGCIPTSDRGAEGLLIRPLETSTVMRSFYCLAYCEVKIAFGIMPWIPLVPSTTWVT